MWEGRNLLRPTAGGGDSGGIAVATERDPPVVGAAFHRHPPSAEATRGFCMYFVTIFLQFTGFRKSVGNDNILGSGQ